MNKVILKNKINQDCNELSFTSKRRRQPKLAVKYLMEHELDADQVAQELASMGESKMFQIFYLLWSRFVQGQVTYASLRTLAKRVGCTPTYLSKILTKLEQRGWLYKQHHFNNSNTYWLHPRFNDGDMWFSLRHVFSGLKVLSLALLFSTCGYGAEHSIQALKYAHARIPFTLSLAAQRVECNLIDKLGINFNYFGRRKTSEETLSFSYRESLKSVSHESSSVGVSTPWVQAHEVDRKEPQRQLPMSSLVNTITEKFVRPFSTTPRGMPMDDTPYPKRGTKEPWYKTFDFDGYDVLGCYPNRQLPSMEELMSETAVKAIQREIAQRSSGTIPLGPSGRGPFDDPEDEEGKIYIPKQQPVPTEEPLYTPSWSPDPIEDHVPFLSDDSEWEEV